MSNIDNLFDKIYQNRRELIRYFITVFLCSVLRVLFSGLGVLAWCAWAILFYVLLKFFVFRSRLDNIYLLLTQIMKYIVCVSVLWFLNIVATGFFMSVTNNNALSLGVSGAVFEILCLIFMYKIVFRKK